MTENNDIDKKRSFFDFGFLCMILCFISIICICTGFLCMSGYNRLTVYQKSLDKYLSKEQTYGGIMSINSYSVQLQKDEDILQSQKGEKQGQLDNLIQQVNESKAKYDEKQNILNSYKAEYTSDDLNELKKKYNDLSNEKYELNVKYMSAICAKNDNTQGKIAYLTFDDGVSVNTEKILDILDRYNIKATFFPNWHGEKAYLYKLIVDRGHAIGNHTASHDWDSVYSSPESFVNEVQTLSQNIYNVTGVYPKIFRFPGGSNNTKYRHRAVEAWSDSYSGEFKIIKEDIKWLYNNGFMYFDWNVSSGDATGNNINSQTLINNVLSQTGSKDRIIVLMHDTAAKNTTVEALSGIIEGLANQGYSFSYLTPETQSYQFIKPVQ